MDDHSRRSSDARPGDTEIKMAAGSEMVKAEPVRAEPVKADPVKAEPVKAEPVRAEPVKAKPVNAEPVRAEPVQAVNPSSNSGQDAEKNKPAARKEAPAKTAALKPLDIVVPEQIGRYAIGRRIGSGTCGVVHQGLDNVLNREVAVKLSPIGEAHASTGKVPGAQRAYQTEIKVAGQLRHPNIVTVHDAGQFEELNYLVMEVINGNSLKEYGKGKTQLPTHRALAAAVACCYALDHSHSQGILHRDIKPANIMLADDGTVKLLDFGIAVGLVSASGLNQQGPTLGTPNYMSPEQILGRDLSPTSDFYSLATVLFELLTGRQLFKAKKVKDLFRTVVHQPAPRLHEVRPDLPVELSDVLDRALAKKPEQRYQTGQEMAEALEPFVDSFRIVEERPPAQQRFIRQLQQQQFFLSFSDVEIAQLLELVKVRHFEPGEALLASGNVERRLMIITDGMVKTTDGGDLIGVRGAGECVGEFGFINGAPETKRMLAMTAVHALEVSADSLSELPPKVHLHYYRFISDLLVERLAHDGRFQLDYTI